MSKPVLLLWVDTNDIDLRKIYEAKVIEHNKHVYVDPFPNSGFDIITNQVHTLESNVVCKIDFNVKCIMRERDDINGFLFVPRSSISKTPLMFANHIGIIDAGYRGHLIGAFRNLDTKSYVVEKHVSLMQICHPSLKPFNVQIVDNEHDLGQTIRGNGCFGSTGL